MKIKDVEKRTGITSYNIRFYEKENLLIPKRNPVNGYREYTEEDILLLNRIKMLRMLDIPVSDIRKILYEKEALTSVLNTHLLKIKEEENRLRQNYFLFSPIGKYIPLFLISFYLTSLLIDQSHSYPFLSTLRIKNNSA